MQHGNMSFFACQQNSLSYTGKPAEHKHKHIAEKQKSAQICETLPQGTCCKTFHRRRESFNLELLIIPVNVEFGAAVLVAALQRLLNKTDFFLCIAWLLCAPEGVAAVGSGNLFLLLALRTTNNYLTHTQRITLTNNIVDCGFNYFLRHD